MSFYAPDLFDSPEEIELAKKTRILQPVWDFIRTGNEDALRSPLFPPFMAVLFYLTVTTVFTIITFIVQDFPWAKKYKFQKDQRVTLALCKPALINSFWNHLLLIFPMATVQLIWVPPTPLPAVAPTLWQFCWHQVLWLFLFDFEYWAWHALHHKVRFLYRWCHAFHHQYHAPFALTTQHLHPWELFCVGLGISVTPWFSTPHCMTYWSWFLLANYMSIEVHTGYELPFAAHHWIPIYGGAPAHDLHHMRPLTNFEPWLNWLDGLCGWKLTHEELRKMKEKRAGEIGIPPKDYSKGLKVVN